MILRAGPAAAHDSTLGNKNLDGSFAVAAHLPVTCQHTHYLTVGHGS